MTNEANSGSGKNPASSSGTAAAGTTFQVRDVSSIALIISEDIGLRLIKLKSAIWLEAPDPGSLKWCPYRPQIKISAD